MRNAHFFSFSIVKACVVAVAVLGVAYIALIAVVMSYAAFTVEFSQSVKNDEASVAALEGQYLAGVSRIQNIDYNAEGYTTPVATIFVPSASVTALR